MPYTNKPVLCLNFDGVLHSYESGWQGANIITDPPVPGSIEFLLDALEHFEIVIHSSRSHQWGGRRAMKRWLKKSLNDWVEDHGLTWIDLPHNVQLTGLPPGFKVTAWPESIVKIIRWPLFKPRAKISLDDRCLTFNGIWPRIDDLKKIRTSERH